MEQSEKRRPAQEAARQNPGKPHPKRGRISVLTDRSRLTKGVPLLKREFTVADEYHFQRSSPVRWIISHLMRYTHLIIAYVLACILANILYTAIPIMTGLAFDAVLQHDQRKLLLISLVLLALVVLGGTSDLGARFFPELLGN